MAASMWRMNGLARSMAGLLVLCTLLLSHAEADPTDPTDAMSTPAPSDSPASSVANLIPTVGGGGSASANLSVTPAYPATINVINIQDGGASGTAAFVPVEDDGKSAVTEVPAEPKNLVVPEVNCVGKDVIPENTAVKATVETDECEATKRIIQENSAPWCNKETCTLEIFQEGNTVSVVSSDATHHNLASALQSEHLKDKLGLTKVETPSSSSSGSSVFVGILVTGLLAAIAITVGYFKCQRKPDAKGVKLAEEAVVDQENQGNTLVSVAPLNPPPETSEKPSVNGESPEAVKTESPPPTNGHSTAKTADTEL